MKRKIEGLKWAKLTPAEKVRIKGTKWQREGLRYERRVWKELGPKGLYNPKILFEDRFGSGSAKPDIVFPERRIIIECKYSACPSAEFELRGLYEPLCREIWKKEDWIMIVVFRRLVWVPEEVITFVEEAKPGVNWLLLPI